MAAKKVLVSYNDCNKIVEIPPQPDSKSEMEFLRKESLKLFKFFSNVTLELVFQKFDNEWETWIDVDESYALQEKDKLKMIVQPTLTSSVTSASQDLEVRFCG